MGQGQPGSQANSCLNQLSILQGEGKLKHNNCCADYYVEDPELNEININDLLKSHKRVYSDQKPNRRESRS